MEQILKTKRLRNSKSWQRNRPASGKISFGVLDIEHLDAGQESNELPGTYTIFITEENFYGRGEPFYIIIRLFFPIVTLGKISTSVPTNTLSSMIIGPKSLNI